MSERELRASPSPDADRLPGSARVAQPGDDDRAVRRPPTRDPRDRQGRRGPPPRRRGARDRRPRRRRAVHRQVSLRPLRRTEAAGGDRAGDHPQPGAARRRRAGVDARHERAGEDPGADAEPQARVRVSPTSTSRTTSRPRSSSATASRSCISAGSSRSDPSEAIYEDPKHPYTKALLRAIPEPDPRRSVSSRPAARRGARRRAAAARMLLPPALPSARSRCAGGRVVICATCSRCAGRRWARSEYEARAGGARRPLGAGRFGGRRSGSQPLHRIPGPISSSSWTVFGPTIPRSRSGGAFGASPPANDTSTSSSTSAFIPRLLPVDGVQVECNLFDEAALARAAAARQPQRNRQKSCPQAALRHTVSGSGLEQTSGRKACQIAAAPRGA